MDSEQFHHLAQEAEMWSTLVVNTWIFFTGATAAWFVFALGREPTFAQTLAAAFVGLALTFGGAFGIGSMWLLQVWVFGQPLSATDYIAGAAILSLIIIVIAGRLAFLFRRDRLNQNQH